MSHFTPNLSPATTAEYEHAHTSAVIFERSATGTIEALGREAVLFLHNVTTNDIRNLAVDAGCEAFLCNHTARVLAHLFIFRDTPEGRKDRLWIDFPVEGQTARVHAHLEHHLVSEDVILTDRTAERARVHLAGPAAAAVLARALGHEADLAALRQQQTELGTVRRTDLLGLPGYDVVCSRERGTALWEMLSRAGAQPAGEEAFEVLRIEAGLPRYGIDMTDQTFAPEVGRTLQAISYNKGCYLGQEPIVMARDRGQVNRTLMRLKLAGAPVPPGCLLYREGKEVGRITSCTFSPRLNSALALAYVRRGNQQPGTAVEVDVQGERRPGEVLALGG
jgi:folate-binding protein YgfZ